MYDVERPFHRLIHHFITRIFYGAGEGDELQLSIPTLLGLLSAPAAFGAIQLLAKYSTFTFFLLRRRSFDVYRASIPDEYFFIVYSMVVTGAVVILKWDRLFPDRQDYDNLAVLPISARQMFGAGLAALLFLAALFAIDINWAACIIFPYAVTSVYDTFAAYSEFFIAHICAVVLASFFVCFGLLSVMGVTLLVVPPRYVRRVSIAVRIVCAFGLVGIASTVFTLPRALLSNQPPAHASYIPAVWFLDLNQSLLESGRSLTGMGVFAALATGVAMAVAISAYALAYYRQFMRITENAGLGLVRGRDKPSSIRRMLDAVILRSPFERGTYFFTVKSLLRSEKHSLLFGMAMSVGVFLAGQTLADALTNPVERGVDPRLLSIPLTLAYFTIISLRSLFDIPAERNANWIFRWLVDRWTHDARGVGMKVILTMIVPWLLLAGLPLHVWAWGWEVALLHTAYVLTFSIALSEVVLARFRKIPFTCARTSSKDRMLVLILACMAGYSLFAPLNARLEASVLQQPIRFLFVLPCLVALVLGVRSLESDLPPSERTLIFDDRPTPLLQELNLFKS